ncbi:MAG: hypothetical protein GF308_10570 [Candidatus Heimdallarchaeota archaeon]|nr:hypothetical protein [Candidatus Heimdallarchaeota archaeon]
MSEEERTEEISPDQVQKIRKLIGDRDEVNLEWLRAVTQIPSDIISKVIIQKLRMVVLDGTVFSKEKAEKRLKKMQKLAQAEVDREAHRKGPVDIDMMKLREKLWTANFPTRVLGQDRHQFCPIWVFLEDEETTNIFLRYDWFDRLNKAIEEGQFASVKEYELENLVNEWGEDYKGKAKVIFAKTKPRNSSFAGKNTSIWVMFLVSNENGKIKLEGFDMLNVLKLSAKFRSREKAYKAFNELMELVNFLVNDPSLFEEIIISS